MRRPTTRQTIISTLVAAMFFALAWFWDDLAREWRAGGVALVALVGALTLLTRRPRPQAFAPPNALVGVLEQVLSDETRRPWNPTTLPWVPTGGTKPVLLVPAADYHLAEIFPLARELQGGGVETRIAIGESPWGRTWQALHWYPDLEMHVLPTPAEVARDISAVVTMKDTGSMTDWVTEVRDHDIPVIGKVEGAQDFWDADTPDARKPYRNLDLVLCQGRFDADALTGRDTAIVGSTRLERLWWAPPVVPRQPLAVINLNFVYGVNTTDRDLWLDTAIEGCEAAGIPYVVSVHPAERTRLKTDRVTRIAAARLLPHATVLISRFSTLPFEAMARGVPFVYHNPHGETVKTFAEPMGAFEITLDAAGLRGAVQGNSEPGHANRARAETFFTNLVDIDRNQRSETRGAEAVKNVYGT